jgi:hypothetical protein
MKLAINGATGTAGAPGCADRQTFRCKDNHCHRTMLRSIPLDLTCRLAVWTAYDYEQLTRGRAKQVQDIATAPRAI